MEKILNGSSDIRKKYSLLNSAIDSRRKLDRVLCKVLFELSNINNNNQEFHSPKEESTDLPLDLSLKKKTVVENISAEKKYSSHFETYKKYAKIILAADTERKRTFDNIYRLRSTVNTGTDVYRGRSTVNTGTDVYLGRSTVNTGTDVHKECNKSFPKKHLMQNIIDRNTKKILIAKQSTKTKWSSPPSDCGKFIENKSVPPLKWNEWQPIKKIHANNHNINDDWYIKRFKYKRQTTNESWYTLNRSSLPIKEANFANSSCTNSTERSRKKEDLLNYNLRLKNYIPDTRNRKDIFDTRNKFKSFNTKTKKTVVHIQATAKEMQPNLKNNRNNKPFDVTNLKSKSIPKSAKYYHNSLNFINKEISLNKPSCPIFRDKIPQYFNFHNSHEISKTKSSTKSTKPSLVKNNFSNSFSPKSEIKSSALDPKPLAFTSRSFQAKKNNSMLIVVRGNVERKRSLRFPRVNYNPLNRIFLQNADQNEASSETMVDGSPEAAVSKNDAARVCSPSYTPESPRSAMAESSSGCQSDSPTSPPEVPIKPSYQQQERKWGGSVSTENSSSSKSILAPSKLATKSNSVASKSMDSTSILLKPSALGTSRLGGGQYSPFNLPTVTLSSSPVEPKPAFKLKPSVLGGSGPSSLAKNPFSSVGTSKESTVESTPSRGSDGDQPQAKRLCTRVEDEKGDDDDIPQKVEKEPKDEDLPNINEEDENPEPKNDDEEEEIFSSRLTTPAFVPLNADNSVANSEESSSKVNGVSTTSTSTFSTTIGRGGGFIFGQNLTNRVLGVSPPTTATNGDVLPPGAVGGEGNLFTEAATSIVSPGGTGAAADGVKTLSETSREFSEKEESLKRKYQEVEVVTGEESEKNVIQMSCKLYGWVNGSWQERGRGILRLNDREVRDELHSRIVIRTQGTLTLMLNAKIWSEMSIEKSNDKSVRFTATGSDGQPKIYLVMGSPKDITLLHNSLEYRVAAARSQSLDEKERKEDLDL